MLAAKEAVNASALAGSGPHGRVIERDVKAALEAAPKTTPLAKAIMKETGAPLPEAGSGLAGMAKGADVGALKNHVYQEVSVDLREFLQRLDDGQADHVVQRDIGRVTVLVPTLAR